MRTLQPSSWGKLLLITLGLLALLPFSSRLPDGLEYTLHRLGLTSKEETELPEKDD